MDTTSRARAEGGTFDVTFPILRPADGARRWLRSVRWAPVRAELVAGRERHAMRNALSSVRRANDAEIGQALDAASGLPGFRRARVALR